jgi:hypothetical protein
MTRWTWVLRIDSVHAGVDPVDHRIDGHASHYERDLDLHLDATLHTFTNTRARAFTPVTFPNLVPYERTVQHTIDRTITHLLALQKLRRKDRLPTLQSPSSSSGSLAAEPRGALALLDESLARCNDHPALDRSREDALAHYDGTCTTTKMLADRTALLPPRGKNPIPPPNSPARTRPSRFL